MGTPCQIDVKLAKIEGRKNATIKDRNGSTYKAPVFMVSKSIWSLVSARRKASSFLSLPSANPPTTPSNTGKVTSAQASHSALGTENGVSAPQLAKTCG